MMDKINSNRNTYGIIAHAMLYAGIFAYLNYLEPKSQKEILECLVRGLKRLEYRGYDSAGLAFCGGQSNSQVCTVGWVRYNKKHQGISQIKYILLYRPYINLFDDFSKMKSNSTLHMMMNIIIKCIALQMQWIS